MFLSVFETFFGLMTLFSVTAGTSNYHNARVDTRNVSPNTLVSTSYLQEYKSSGTSVTFRITDETDIYTSDVTKRRSAYWFFYYDLPNSTSSAGSIEFYITKDENNDFALNFSRAPYESVNLHVNCWIEWSMPSNTYDEFSLDLTRSYTDGWSYSTSQPNFDTDYFDDGGVVYITFELEPVSQQEWYGYYQEGYDDGYESGYGEGKNAGATEAAEYYSQQDTTAVTIFTGILNIGLMPINFFLGILNFEVFGINIGALVASFMTIAITLIIVRIIFSGGNGKDS